MNPELLTPYTIDHHSITLIHTAQKHQLPPEQLHNLLRFYNNQPLNLKLNTK